MHDDGVELVRVAVAVTASPDELWQVLTDFGRPQRLAPSIERCTVTGSGVGAVRVVVSSRGPVIHERLTVCDRSRWRFEYDVLDTGDMPFAGMTRYRAIVTLVPLDAVHTSVDWRAHGRVDGDPAPICAAIEALYRGAIARLAREATT